MIVFILLVFGLATVRSCIPLIKPENVTYVNVVFAILHIVAFVYLLNYFVSLKAV
jgi:hypothetical protein